MKIKVYVYPIAEKDRKYAKPDLLLNPIGDDYFTWTTNRQDADFYYSPCDLGLILWDKGVQGIHQFVESLPFWHGRGHRHFFHDYSACSDDWGLPAVLFRAVKSRHDPNPRTISIPHTVDDFHPQPVDFSQLPYDICFVGRVGACEVRRIACESVANDPRIKSYMKFRDTFWGYVERDDPKLAAEQRTEFIEAMAQSRLVLSPRGVELDAYRTWEGMSAGRGIIWIGDDYELPFQDLINYNLFMHRIYENEAHNANESVRHTLTCWWAGLEEVGRIARETWLEYFSREQVPKTYAHYLRKFL